MVLGKFLYVLSFNRDLRNLENIYIIIEHIHENAENMFVNSY